ncbi:hypothetical protein K8B33_15050 [Alcanivorax sp. JB21]|uniref:START domain-containing protein n=1 Tax=Alcanivorax limicola TaxID=2874102 RepID=UPI001CBC009B|nr:START domain-containing protein [Alcanivorax limicola]MBZ2190426.1 hypothetical protein [Alcanivorax limicola]
MLRTRQRLASLIALMLLLPLQTLADDAEWEQIREARERGDVATYVRPVDGTPIKQFRGIVEVPHPLVTVMAVISDVANFDNWVFQCKGTEMREEEWGGEHARVMIRGIWPVSDRDVLVRSHYEQDPDTHAVTVHSTATDDVLEEQRGYVRIPALNNVFRFEPLSDGWTRITFQTLVNPGGAIPAWLSNFVSTRAPLQTLEGMSEQMEKDDYQLSSPEQLPVSLPGSPTLIFPENHRASTRL